MAGHCCNLFPRALDPLDGTVPRVSSVNTLLWAGPNPTLGLVELLTTRPLRAAPLRGSPRAHVVLVGARTDRTTPPRSSWWTIAATVDRCRGRVGLMVLVHRFGRQQADCWFDTWLAHRDRPAAESPRALTAAEERLTDGRAERASSRTPTRGPHGDRAGIPRGRSCGDRCAFAGVWWLLPESADRSIHLLGLVRVQRLVLCILVSRSPFGRCRWTYPTRSTSRARN